MFHPQKRNIIHNFRTLSTNRLVMIGDRLEEVARHPVTLSWFSSQLLDALVPMFVMGNKL